MPVSYTHLIPKEHLQAAVVKFSFVREVALNATETYYHTLLFLYIIFNDIKQCCF